MKRLSLFIGFLLFAVFTAVALPPVIKVNVFPTRNDQTNLPIVLQAQDNHDGTATLMVVLATPGPTSTNTPTPTATATNTPTPTPTAP